MTERSSESRERRPWVALLAFIAGVVLILPVEAVAWALVARILDFPEGTDSEAVFIGLWLLIVVVPLVWLWLRGGLRRRWFATGAAFSMVLLVASFGVTASQPVADESTSARLSAIEADSQFPVYYVGPRFHGWRIDVVGIDHRDDQGLDESDTSFDGGESLYLGYGTTCTSSTSGRCGNRFELSLHAMTRADLEHRCIRRLPTRRGITPVELEDYGVVIFVGPLAIRLPDQPPDSLVTDTVTALRRVGTKPTSDDLPAPPYEVGQVIADCFVRPRG